MRLARKPGQSQDRYAQTLGRDEVDASEAEPRSPLEERVRNLEEEVAALRQELITLRDRSR